MIGKFCKLGDNVYQLFANELHSLIHHDNVRIVADVAGGGAEVNNSGCLRALLTVGVYVAHDVVTHNLFTFLCNLVVNVFRVLL